MTDFVPLTAFVIGLLGGVHCLGMCGGIVGALTFGLPESQRRGLKLLPYQLAYNLGRILSYTLAGAVAGGLGVLLGGVLPVQVAQNVLILFAAVFMILMGLYIGGWWNGLTLVEKAGGGLWRRVEPLGRKMMPVTSAAQAFILGLVWGWLPCGLVYSVLVWAVSAGGAQEGAVLMAAFGLGTLPNLLLMGAAAGWLGMYIKKPGLRYVAGGLIIAYGLYMLASLYLY